MEIAFYFFKNILLSSTGQLVDIILIATQTVGPADGSHYIINYFGARLIKYELDNDTYRMPQPDWQEL
jgi:hypothetical protein